MIFRIGTAIFHRDVAVTISITSRLSPLDSMDLIKININFEPYDAKVNRIYLMNTMINAPEVKKMSAIVLNAIADVTQYIDDEDINEEVKFHTTTHKQVVDVVKTNDINLLIACVKHGIKDMYNELKELNK